MSIADEIMELVDGYVAGCMGEEDAPEPRGYFRALKSRLISLETELNNLRRVKPLQERSVIMSNPDKPVQSLTDESQAILNEVAKSIALICEGPNAGWGIYGDLLLPVARRIRAIESELEELRKLQPLWSATVAVSGVGYTMERFVAVPKSFEQPSGLPCSSELGDEEGG